MAATRADIQRWIDARKDATHMIVVCDTYDYDDFPVYVEKDQDVYEHYQNMHGKNMQKVMEVYSFTGQHTIEDQMAERRAFNYD